MGSSGMNCWVGDALAVIGGEAGRSGCFVAPSVDRCAIVVVGIELHRRMGGRGEPRIAWRVAAVTSRRQKDE
jgi:hypothetical protein